MSFVNDLREWRAKRNIVEANYPQYVKNVLEEILEPIYSKEDIKRIVKEIYSVYFADCIIYAKENEILDSMNDICVFSINEVELMGYNFNLTMNETIEEISSREQNPIQKLQWGKFGSSGKWEKDKEQHESTLYKADYEICKLKGKQ
jgi:hypothetical protein